MAVSREEMLMQSIATGSPSNVVPVTREEKYLSFIAGESASKPNAPITRKEVFLDKIPQGGGSGGGGVTIRNQNKTITENGTYTADSGYTGLGTVTVEVASGGGGGGDFDALIEGTLTEVSSGATKVSKYTFCEYDSLTSVYFPNAMSIGAYAFQNCQKFTSADFPNVTSIRDCAFYRCVNLTNLNIPKAEGTIGGSAFYGCESLTSVDFPNATFIANRSFQNCKKLTSADFLNVTGISSNAFTACYILTAVILRSDTMCNLSSTGAFNSCYHILGTVDSTYNPNGDKDGYFYVPRALLSDTDATKDYRRATNWSTYSTQFRALEDYTVDGTITGALDPNKI